MEGINPVRVGVGLTNLLGWGAQRGLSKFTLGALGSSVHKSRGSSLRERTIFPDLQGAEPRGQSINEVPKEGEVVTLPAGDKATLNQFAVELKLRLTWQLREKVEACSFSERSNSL